MSNIGSMSELYTDSTTNRMHLFRKDKGFSPDILVKALEPALKMRESLLQNKVDAITKEQEALNEVNVLFKVFRDTSLSLSSPTVRSPQLYIDLLNEKPVDAFASRTASLSPNNTSNPVLNVEVKDSTPLGGFSINIDHVAQRDTITSTVAIPSTGSLITVAETDIYLNGVEITIPQNANLYDIANLINQQKAVINITASTKKYSSTDYRLFL